MFALGLQGSPRKKGNSELLLAMFMQALERQGVRTQTLPVCRLELQPCLELLACEKNGFCPIKDEMDARVYSLLRQADIVVAASPVFFYNVTAQLKALIDRCQAFWARKYLLKLKDPGAFARRGFLLAVGASGGKQLFDGLHLTAKYFFDAIDAEYAGHLVYRNIESRGAIQNHPGVSEDVERAATALVADLRMRRKVLIVDQRGACRSQMAAAFVARSAARKIEGICAGIEPATKIDPLMVAVMREKGIDMDYRVPQSVAAAMGTATPDTLITLDQFEPPRHWTGIARLRWDLPPAAESAIEEMRTLRDLIEAQVNAYIAKQ
jgi:arsenate reductase (thioredoxin)